MDPRRLGQYEKCHTNGMRCGARCGNYTGIKTCYRSLRMETGTTLPLMRDRCNPNPDEALANIDMFKCGVCRELVRSPVYTCCGGRHLFCCDCGTRARNCPICGALIVAKVNVFAEQFLETTFIACKYKEDGCKKVIRGTIYRDHIDNCPYRPICCFISRCGRIVPIRKFLEHLQKDHPKKVNGVDSNTCSVEWWIDGSPNSHARWPPYYLTCFDNVFLYMAMNTGLGTCEWCWILADDSEAKRFCVHSKLKNIQRTIELNWKGPVHSIRKPITEITQCGQCLLTSCRDFGNAFLFQKERSDRKFYWSTLVEIEEINVKEENDPDCYIVQNTSDIKGPVVLSTSPPPPTPPIQELAVAIGSVESVDSIASSSLSDNLSSGPGVLSSDPLSSGGESSDNEEMFFTAPGIESNFELEANKYSIDDLANESGEDYDEYDEDLDREGARRMSTGSGGLDSYSSGGGGSSMDQPGLNPPSGGSEPFDQVDPDSSFGGYQGSGSSIESPSYEPERRGGFEKSRESLGDKNSSSLGAYSEGDEGIGSFLDTPTSSIRRGSVATKPSPDRRGSIAPSSEGSSIGGTSSMGGSSFAAESKGSSGLSGGGSSDVIELSSNIGSFGSYEGSSGSGISGSGGGSSIAPDMKVSKASGPGPGPKKSGTRSRPGGKKGSKAGKNGKNGPPQSGSEVLRNESSFSSPFEDDDD